MDGKFYHRVLICLSLGLLFSCGPAVMFPPGQKLLQGGSIAPKDTPEALRAKLKTTIIRGKKKSNLTVLISALPYQKYRMEFKGPLGSHLGDLYWVQDSNWILSIPGEDLYRVGAESEIHLPGLVLDSLDIHFVLGFLWEQLIPPGNYSMEPSNGKGTLGKRQEGGAFFLASKSNQVRWTSMGAYRLEYLNYSGNTGVVRPHKVKLYKSKKLLLEWTIHKIEYNPHWKRSPFTAPESFQG